MPARRDHGRGAMPLARAIVAGQNLHRGGLVTRAMRLEAMRQKTSKSQRGMTGARLIRAARSID